MSQPTWMGCCPVPRTINEDCITLEHGEGGSTTRKFIEREILARFKNHWLNPMDDAARLRCEHDSIALTTDSFVVSPLFFPGGDIGSLSVHGTVNDLAVVGAKPQWLTISLMIEEGFPIAVLREILDRAATAANDAGVAVVAGDTKVVTAGAVDGLFITTTGVGEFAREPFAGPGSLTPGDELLVSGPLGRHGIAVLTAREGLDFNPPPQSDSASLIPIVEALRNASIPVRAIRDATRGGVAAVLHEWAASSKHSMCIDERNIPLTPEVRGVCELLGIDPLHVACEGTLVAVVEQGRADAAVEAIRQVSQGRQAARIGVVAPRAISPVLVRRSLGAEQPLDDPPGSPMPRIC